MGLWVARICGKGETCTKDRMLKLVIIKMTKKSEYYPENIDAKSPLN